MANDPNAGKYKRQFKREFKIAELVLKPFDGQLTWSTHDYEAFRFTAPTVTLLFYPHKTSASNYSCRVRDQGSKDKRLAAELMIRLRIGNGHTTAFHSKTNYTAREEHRLVMSEGLKDGWAREQVK